MKYLQSGDYTNVKDVYLCFGGDEVFLACGESIKKQLESYGAHVSLEVGEGMYHCYAIMPFVPEAYAGYEHYMDYIKKYCSPN